MTIMRWSYWRARITDNSHNRKLWTIIAEVLRQLLQPSVMDEECPQVPIVSQIR